MSYLESRANLEGRVAAIVGGAAGIGRGITLALAQSGVDVALCDHDAQAVEQIQTDVRALGRRIVATVADATDRAQLKAFYDAAEQTYDRLDILVNVVGGVRRRNFLDGSAEEDDADIRRNYGYMVDSVRHAIPLIRRGGRGGAIVNFTTIEAHRGAATFAVYAGAKAATANFTRAIAVELANEGIRANTLAPDTTPSKGNFQALTAEQRARMADLGDIGQEGLKMYIPMKVQPPVDALADGVLFLVSDLSRFVTGTTLHVDGGTMASAGFVDWPFGDGFLCVPRDGVLSRLYRES
jgi:NAD(P)-dependent dehydrogenase (short-subunit alcohol dehydrogenase family)